MAQKGNQETVTGLDKLIADARVRLAANPDYIALKALEKARAEIVGVSAKHRSDALDAVMGDLNVQAANGTLFAKRVSQLAGAAETLEKMGHPMPAKELMDGAINAGAVIDSKNPLTSFGSSLSKSEKFKSVRWKGKYAWWFSDRPLPSSVVRIRPKEAAE